MPSPGPKPRHAPPSPEARQVTGGKEQRVIRLAVVIGSLDVGGAERHLCQVLPRLDPAVIRAGVVTLTGRGALADAMEAAGIQVTSMADGAKWAAASRPRRAVLLFMAAMRLVAWLRRERPAMVHFFLPAAYLVGGLAAFLARVPVRIMSRRSLNHYQSKHPALARFEHWLHHHMDLLLANSEAVARDLLAEGADPALVRTLYNGIDTDRLQTGSEREARRQAVRLALGILPDAVAIICVANLFAYKGHADILDALARLPQELLNNCCLLLVGRDAGCLQSLQAQAGRFGLEGMVSFLGERHDVPDLLAGADIGLLASHEEGFSNAILESMASQLPMIVTDVGGNTEAVPDGVCGLVVPARSPEFLSAAMERLLADPELRRSMGAAARARVMSHYSVASCAQDYQALYQALSARGQAHDSAGQGK